MAKPASAPYSPDRAIAGSLPRLRQPKAAGVTVSAAQMGKHLDLTYQRILQLAEEGVIARLPTGKFDQDDCRLRYLRWLRDPSRRVVRSQADADFVKAKTELIAIRVAEKKGELIEYEVAKDVAEKLIGVALTAMGGMAARCGGGDIRLRDKINEAVYEARTQMTNTFNDFAKEAKEKEEEEQRLERAKTANTEEEDEA